MDTGLIRPYSVIQWKCQWSAFRGWPSHSMCSRPHFTGKPDWPRADFTENCLLRAGSKASAVSRFREKLSPANGVQGITAISRKIALLGVISAKLAKWVAKKWGPTCDRDIYDSVIYTTAIYRAYTVFAVLSFLGPKFFLISFSPVADRMWWTRTGWWIVWNKVNIWVRSLISVWS